MRWKSQRRNFLRGLTTTAAAGLAGCIGESGTNLLSLNQPAATTGKVIDLSGDPIANATLTAIDGTTTQIAETTSDNDGTFAFDVGTLPVWLRTDHKKYLNSVQAVAPGSNNRIRLTEQEGTVSMGFGGDMMFGRRFYEPRDDPLAQRYRINPDQRLQDHKQLLGSIEPLLQTPDVMSANLESPLTTSNWRHPEKEFTFVSHPAAAQALKEAGINYVALGNNHVFDALAPGFDDTLQALNDAKLAYSGAGSSSSEAWNPHLVEQNGLTVAYISCTTVTGDQYEIDWAASGDPQQTHTVEASASNGTRETPQEIKFPGSVGVAAAEEESLRSRIQQAKRRADVVVVQIHGGTEYEPTQTEEVQDLTNAAVDAGADLIVNHHPHVSGGVEQRDGATIAWTLGNLVFDQVLWPTLHSFVLFADVGADGVKQARIEPIILEGYVPRGTVGRLRDKITWETAGYSSEDYRLIDDSLKYLPNESTKITETRQLNQKNSIYARRAGWVTSTGNTSKPVRLGRDRLLTGNFENEDVDIDGYEGPLWRFGRDRFSSEDKIGYNESGGITLLRNRENDSRAILTPNSRLPTTADEFTFTGRYKYNNSTGLDIQFSWYDAPSGESFSSRTVTLGGTEGDWERVQFELKRPANASYINLFVSLKPPEGLTVRRVTFDDLRLIEWAPPPVSGGRAYDHIAISEPANIEFQTVASKNETIDWRPLSK